MTLNARAAATLNALSVMGRPADTDDDAVEVFAEQLVDGQAAECVLRDIVEWVGATS